MTERIGKDDEIFLGVERLSRPEQFAGKGRRQHAHSRTAGAMQNDNRNSFPFPDRPIVKADLGKNLAGMKAEVARNPVAFFRSGIVRGVRDKRDHCESEYGGGSEEHLRFPHLRCC
jgi:hypothetical protein